MIINIHIPIVMLIFPTSLHINLLNPEQSSELDIIPILQMKKLHKQQWKRWI